MALRLTRASRGSLASWLEPQRGPLLAPLRRGGAVDAQTDGRALAIQHGTPSLRLASPSFFPRLTANVDLLRAAQLSLHLLDEQGQSLGAAGDWLMDQIESLALQIRAVRAGLPRHYYRRLPVLTDPVLAATPRVLALAWEWVALGDGQLRVTQLAEFLRGYQDVHLLTLGELWALSTTLRVVLIENLRRLVERVVTQAAARGAAEAWLLGQSRRACAQ